VSEPAITRADERRVIFASSLGTVFEWYDFYLYATLAPFFAALFFPKGNDTAALLSAFATYAAGFLVRPFGALVFGRIGDLVGRKFTFLVTITVMGFSTALVGILPTYAQIGILAPIILVTLRLAQGLARSSPGSRSRASRPRRRGAIRSGMPATASSSSWRCSAQRPARPSSGTRASSRRCSSWGPISGSGSRTPT
jgi:MFS family permease